jgi:hypothetical protein
MSVIGRLDEQVDEVLISPLEKKRRADPIRRDERAEGERSLPAPAESPTEPESDGARDELPVWLL